MTPIFIAGYNQGLTQDKKPFLLPDQAFSTLENGYAWRERIKQREPIRTLGRLRRVITAKALGNTDGAGSFSGNIISIAPALEATAEIQEGSISITIGAATFVEASPPDGTLTDGAAGTGTINYVTGLLTITGAPAATPITIDFAYYPNLPVMGIFQRELGNVNDEQTIFFDTKYAYRFLTNDFVEFISGTTWTGTNSDFFWATNYRGSDASTRLFFVTNFVNDANNPIRYTDGSTWNDFFPIVSQTGGVATRTFITQAKIMIPYYGRLLALNVWETPADAMGDPDYAQSKNIFNRCRFSQIGNPLETTVALPYIDVAWRSDQFGKGGFIDAPTNEAIISAAFIKNTLLVFFERSTWQLRYVGEYGLPFIWERVSSDLGSESKSSAVLFDNGVLAVGDKGIISADATGIKRIDEAIPDAVFGFRNAEAGIERVVGVRDFQKEVVYWSYVDSQFPTVFPNRVLVYNYRNGTFAIFRDSITFLGTFQPDTGILWSSTTVKWEDEGVYWYDPLTQSQFPFIVSGNQEGFVHYYASPISSIDQPSLSITDIDLTSSPIKLTVRNHNLQTGEIISIDGLLFLDNGVPPAPAATDLNGKTYAVRIDPTSVNMADEFYILKWDTTTQSYVEIFDFTPDPLTSTYVGGGTVTLHPKPLVRTKDFNPFQNQGSQGKMIYADLLFTASSSAEMTINVLVNSSLAVTGNLVTGNRNIETYLPSPYYVIASDYAWHRFYATVAGQYIRLEFTYDDDIMNNLTKLNQRWEINALTLWFRQGGKVVF